MLGKPIILFVESEEPAMIAEMIAESSQTSTHMYCARFFSDEKIHFYTGLETYSKFLMVLGTLGEAAHHLNYYYGYGVGDLTVEDQFFLTLIKLRRFPPNVELSYWFNISDKQVSNIFITWINFMFHQWSEVDFWVPRELVQYYAPTDFFNKFPKTRAIIDGTEVGMQKPNQPVAQQATFSSYKNKNTMKAMVGASPGGLCTYISEAYGGSASDRQIVERSTLPKMCDPGDEVNVSLVLINGFPIIYTSSSAEFCWV